MSPKSLRELYDEVERRVTPPVETVVHSEEFATALKVVDRARGAIGGRLDAVAAAVLHAANLPAGSDIRKLRRQVGDLDYEVRRLRRDIAEQGDAPRPAGDVTERPATREGGDDAAV